MPTYKNRKEVWDAYTNMAPDDWNEWVASLATPASQLDKPLYHISFNPNLEGIWNPSRPKGTTEAIIVHDKREEDTYEDSMQTMFAEITPDAICTSPDIEGCWYGVYLNVVDKFKNRSEEMPEGEVFVYKAVPTPDTRILTPEVLNDNFLVWDAYLTQEHRILDHCQMALQYRIRFMNTADYPETEMVYALPYNRTSRYFDALYPPFIPISREPINRTRIRPMPIYSTESFTYQHGALTGTTSNAKIMKQISLEAQINPIAKLHSGIKDKFLLLLDNISSFHNSVGAFLSGNTSFKTYKLNVNHAGSVIKTDYMSLMEQNLEVPEGFKGPYLPYAQLIKDTLIEFQDLPHTTTKPCVQTLSVYLSNPEKLRSVTIDLSKKVDDKSKVMLKFKDTLSKYFDPSSTSNIATYAQLFGSNADFVSAARLAKDIESYLTNSKTRKSLEEVDSDINDISNLVDKLIVRAKQDDATYTLNSHTAKTLALGIDAIAEVITFYGALLHMAEEAHGTVHLAIEKLK